MSCVTMCQAGEDEQEHIIFIPDVERDRRTDGRTSKQSMGGGGGDDGVSWVMLYVVHSIHPQRRRREWRDLEKRIAQLSFYLSRFISIYLYRQFPSGDNVVDLPQSEN